MELTGGLLSHNLFICWELFEGISIGLENNSIFQKIIDKIIRTLEWGSCSCAVSVLDTAWSKS